MKLFLPQTTFEAWSADEKADLSDGKLVVFETRASHAVLPAVHFLKLVSGSDDNTLIGKVKTMAQLDALGAEHMADSVILGETAYEVAPGYITEVEKPAEPKKGDKGPPKKVSSPEADLLAAFILDKL